MPWPSTCNLKAHVLILFPDLIISRIATFELLPLRIKKGGFISNPKSPLFRFRLNFESKVFEGFI